MTESRQTKQADPPPPPPRWDEADWESYSAEPGPGEPPPTAPRARPRPDLSPLFMLLDALRRGVPRELQDQWGALVREVLLTVRALIDWYLERLDGPHRATQVEDIPID